MKYSRLLDEHINRHSRPPRGGVDGYKKHVQNKTKEISYNQQDTTLQNKAIQLTAELMADKHNNKLPGTQAQELYNIHTTTQKTNPIIKNALDAFKKQATKQKIWNQSAYLLSCIISALKDYSTKTAIKNTNKQLDCQKHNETTPPSPAEIQRIQDDYDSMLKMLAINYPG